MLTDSRLQIAAVNQLYAWLIRGFFNFRPDKEINTYVIATKVGLEPNQTRTGSCFMLQASGEQRHFRGCYRHRHSSCMLHARAWSFPVVYFGWYSTVTTI